MKELEVICVESNKDSEKQVLIIVKIPDDFELPEKHKKTLRKELETIADYILYKMKNKKEEKEGWHW